MEYRKLKVEGAVEFVPRLFPDARGQFAALYQESVFAEAAGRPFFPVAQTNCSVSQRGALRGIHFTATPPGSMKYVYCAHGSFIDMVVDLRVGSPTFGRWDAIHIDSRAPRAVFLPAGLGHAFLSLEDGTAVTYLCSEEYAAENEFGISALDPALGLPIPDDIEIILSERDRGAPSMAEARAQGLFPSYADCLKTERADGS
ncbi:dTDP-4-dehydrorhamnose 3,5-epimerase family protein [Micromonospora eburnea]|uniref:Epimerase EvaD n=1 Tax=Micromonospora eburnea TaxID=227316 RepID=A0A1C6V229_9ACTN|nr:dTDP-4-dehydrorhamnose 3,5-epimerase [Micromonospora eburnea]SCL59980.1 epimerase EvaD [Micromonospora eburnea]